MIIIIWVILSLCVGAWGEKRGEGFVVSFLLSLFLSPLLVAIIIAVREPKVKNIEQKAIESGGMKKCPHCAELIRKEAIKCRYCQSDLPAVSMWQGGVTSAVDRSPIKASSDISFVCNACQQHIVIVAEGAGLVVQCPKCGISQTVPQTQTQTPRWAQALFGKENATWDWQ